jgi:hypothetical protein
MKIRATAIALCALALMPAAQASQSCDVREPGAYWSFRIHIGEEWTKADINQFNLRQLKRTGVDATRAEMWGSCIRAYVRKPGGGEEMQYFHPDTFERVYLY